MNIKKEVIDVDLSVFLEENSITIGENGELKGLTIEKLREVSIDFLDSVVVGDDRYIGFDGYLQHILSVLLDKAIKAPKDSEEFNKASKELEEFKYYCKKYLGFEQKDGGFIDTNKSLA